MLRVQVCATSRFVFAISDGVLYVLRADVQSATPDLSLACVSEKHPISPDEVLCDRGGAVQRRPVLG